MANFRSSAAYRIAIAFAAALTWSVLLLGVVVYYVANTELRQLRDGDIAEELERLSTGSSRRELVRELEWRAQDKSRSRFHYALFSNEGTRLAGTLDLAMPPTGYHEFPQDQPGNSVTRFGAIDVAGNDRLVIATGSRVIELINAMILKLIIALFAVMLLICAVGGVVMAWYLRHRLKAITRTANAIITGDIEWRVPVSSRGDEFDVAGTSVNLMLDRIAALMENLRQVSSDIAHDLRRPLIRLLLQTDRLGEAGAEQRVTELGDELLLLFSGILRIAEIEGGGLAQGFEPIELSELMNEMAESFAPALNDEGVSIDWTIEPGITVTGNRELLAQLVSNLLDNARVHTPAGTVIFLTLASSGDDVKLVVEDNGPGVPEEDRQKLLQRFFRAESSRTTPGNGLGLSLVEATARSHGGTVAIEDAEPGLRIVVTLPKLTSRVDAIV